MGHKEHRKKAPRSLALAIVSVSSTRSLENDESGRWIVRRAGREGHKIVAHQMVPDHADIIRHAVLHIMADHAPAALIVTGGTGIAPKDVTIEALQPLFSKELTGFSSLFTQLSYEEIDAAAMLSRATAGVIGRTLVFCLPGSLKACKLACKELIFPELGHLCSHLGEG